MAKIYKTSEDIEDFILTRFSSLDHLISFEVMSLTKSKSILKVAKANATTEYLTKKEGVVTVFVYEEAFDRLPDLGKEIITDLAFAQVQYDTDKDKINIEANPYKPLFSIRKTYGDEKVLNTLELQEVIIQDIEREEKEKKEAEKESKKKPQQL